MLCYTGLYDTSGQTLCLQIARHDHCSACCEKSEHSCDSNSFWQSHHTRIDLAMISIWSEMIFLQSETVLSNDYSISISLITQNAIITGVLCGQCILSDTQTHVTHYVFDLMWTGSFITDTVSDIYIVTYLVRTKDCTQKRVNTQNVQVLDKCKMIHIQLLQFIP